MQKPQIPIAKVSATTIKSLGIMKQKREESAIKASYELSWVEDMIGRACRCPLSKLEASYL